MTKLTSQKRKNLPTTAFAEPGERKYPIPDISHARNALARASGNATPTEQEAISREVHRRFPTIGKKKK